MKNRYGDEYHWEKLNDKEYKFVMEGDSLKYCRYGGKEGQESIDMNDLGMFDPHGGPFVQVDSKIYYDEILGGQEGDEPLVVKHIRDTEDGFVVKVERMSSNYQNAIVKFNNGRGACLCDGCSVILSYGFKHADVKRYCEKCYEKHRSEG